VRSFKTASVATKVLVTIVGAAVSLVAGYISISGLVSLFPAGGIALIAMAASMELGKVVAVACYQHATGLMRVVLTLLIAILMTITGLGVYGFLSSSHQADRAPALAAEAQASRWSQDLTLARDTQKRAEDTLRQMDAAVEALMTARRITGAQVLRNQQSSERNRVSQTLDRSVEDQRRILEQQANARTITTHSELTPIRFAANALGWSEDQALTLMILLLMLAFDPLGMVLVAIGAGIDCGRKKTSDAAEVTLSKISVSDAAKILRESRKRKLAS